METIHNPLLIDALATRKSESNFSNLCVDFKSKNLDTIEYVYSPVCKRKSPLNQLQLLHWAPSEGNASDTIMIILKQISPGSLQGYFKMVFGHMPVETLSYDHSSPPGGMMPQSTTLVTLMAKVPNVESIQLNNQGKIPVSVCFYDLYKHDMVVGSCTIGTFSYHNSSLQQRAQTQTISTQSLDEKLQKRTPSVVTGLENSSVNGQTSQPFESFNPVSLDHELPGALFRQNCGLSTWIIQLQLQQQQQQQQQKEHNRQKLFTSVNSLDDLYRHHLPTDSSNVVSLLGGTTIQSYKQDQNFDTIDTLCHNYPVSSNHGNSIGHEYGSARQSQHQTDANSLIEWVDVKGAIGSSSTQYGDDFMKPDLRNCNNTGGNINNYQSLEMGTSRYSLKRSHYHRTSTSNGINHASNVHPYVGILNKANLKICGDLMEMTYKWTANEWCSCRRLVRFWRSQSTSDMGCSQQVECGFEPIEYYNHQNHHHQQQQQQHNFHVNSTISYSASHISPELDRLSYRSTHDAPLSSLSRNPDIGTEFDNHGTARTATSFVVSCIYWSERDDYYITSVDCIYLLEGLIGVQFSVEEKNRIRRNLEGFRPLTVSKCRMDCAEFFKLIMDFPHPKPRNIEKDVKVFAWKSLPQALRKIVRKYTSNYTKIRTSSISSTPIPSPQPITDPSFAYQQPVNSSS